jgi:subtilase family serine protease
VAIKHLNFDQLERTILELSTPGSPKYQKWLSRDEVNEIVKNPESSNIVIAWLRENDIRISSISSSGHFITAVASISKWEELLNTQFYEWEVKNYKTSEKSKQVKTVIRSEEYHLPHSLVSHIHAIFNTCQALPHVVHHAVPRSAKPIATTSIIYEETNSASIYLRENVRSQTKMKIQTSSVTVSFLETYYYIDNKYGIFFILTLLASIVS